jgi:opacity protein-like surface antigen
MKKLLIIAASLAFASSAFASVDTQYDSAHVNVGSFQSKASAFQAGFNYIDQLQQMQQNKLRFKLRTFADTDGPIVIDNTSVKLQEYAPSQGENLYKAIVNVDYHVRVHDDS